jgi:TATA-box binding protein (TBP) (component of TFIID and TFIIIB)
MISPETMKKEQEFTKELNKTLSMLVLPVISTMTIAIVLDKSINLENLKSRMKDPDIKDFIKQVYGVEDGLQLKTKGLHFNNSLVFRTAKQKKLSQAIKVFCNGSLHITGYKNVKDALDAADIFSTLIELCEGGNGISDMYNIMDFSIQLINAYYIISQIQHKKEKILLSTFHTLLKEYTEYYTSYNNDHYAGVVLKSPSFTIMVFESGNIILSSITTPKDMEDAYNYISEFISTNYKSFITETLVKEKRGKPNYNDYGDFFLLK